MKLIREEETQKNQKHKRIMEGDLRTLTAKIYERSRGKQEEKIINCYNCRKSDHIAPQCTSRSDRDMDRHENSLERNHEERVVTAKEVTKNEYSSQT